MWDGASDHHPTKQPEDPEVFKSIPSQSPSWPLVRKPDHPGTQYCLEIQVISTKDNKAIPPTSHAWQAPIMEDMVWEGRAGLTKAVVTGPGRDIHFYGQQSLGEGLSLGEARDAMFTLSGVIAWVGKLAQLTTKPVSLSNGRQLITQAIAKGHIKPRGPGCPHYVPPASMPFSFHNQDLSPWPANLPVAAEWWEVPWLGPWAGQQEQGWVL